MEESAAQAISIAHYRVSSKLGQGGMGEVYRATDTKLGRDVAIKVLPDLLAHSPDRLARFAREARVLASLNHPNIASIYGVEERALIMELVEGPTLEERIAQGPVPIPEALEIARQIAEALEYAHDRGVVHRDLKPANVKVSHDGRVKVLDFGLAKAVANDPVSGDPGASPTLTMQATVAGVIMGTAAYMSPEQARGKSADRRSDIWSYGVLLVEMLSGRRMYGGETISDTLASVLKDAPDLARLPAGTPAAIRMLLKRCLDKDPQWRLQAIGEARVAIKEALSGPAVEETSALPPSPQASRRPWWRSAGWIAAVIAIAALGVVAAIHLREKPAETPVVRFSISAPDKAASTMVGSALRPPALSPDGTRLVFNLTSLTGTSQLWLRSLDTLEARPLPGTEGSGFAFWSPDGKSLAFFADGKLKRVDINGGPAITVADAPNGRGGAWGPDGDIVFAPDRQGPLFRVSQAGGVARPVTSLAQGESSHRLPWFLPKVHSFLFAAPVTLGSDHVKVYAASIDKPGAQFILEADSNAVYSDGHLLFLRDATLMAQAFDPKRLNLAGEAVPVAERVQRVTTSAAGMFTASATGMLVYQSGASVGPLSLCWFDRTGKRLDTVGQPGAYQRINLSPDRKSLAVGVIEGSNSDVWIFDILRGLRTRFTFDPAIEYQGIWSPDGRTVVFDSLRKGHFDLYRRPADGSSSEEVLFADNSDKNPTSWSPDGKYILYNTTDAKTGQDIVVLPLNAEKPGAPVRPFPFMQTSFSESNGQFSPDGRWIVYQSSESGRSEIYLAPFPGPGGKRQVSERGGALARWRKDGKEILFAAGDQKLMSAEVTLKGASVEVGQIRPLFGPVLIGMGYMYDLSADGQRILAAVPPETSTSEPMTVVQHWVAGLRR